MARYGTAEQQMKDIAQLASQQPAEIRERRSAAEATLGQLEAGIGRAGSYDLPGAGPPTTSSAPEPDPEVEIGLLSKDGYKFGKLKDVKRYDKLLKKGYSKEEAADQIGANRAYVEGGIFKQSNTQAPIGTGGKSHQKTTSLDSDAAVEQYESSSAFRQVSRMMAESEQMLARSGPLYEEMLRSRQLPIIEASVSAARENTENIRKAMARGGSARRDGFEAITRIRTQEKLNMDRGQALAKAHTEMDLWARANSKEVINFAHGWATNQAGIRQSYQNAMDSASQLMAQAAIPYIFASEQKEQEYRDAASAQRRGNVMRQINTVIGVVGSVASIVGAVYGGPGPGASMAATQAASEGGARSTSTQGPTVGGGTPAQATMRGEGGTSTLGGDIKSMASSVGSAIGSAANYITGGW